MRSPVAMGEQEIRQYLLHMVEQKKISRETYRQIRAALKFLYTVTLKRPTEVAHVPVRRRKVRLPVVLSGTEVRLLLAAIRRPKYQGIVMAQYAAGLRISEACRRRPKDIDSKRMVIHVRAGKDVSWSAPLIILRNTDPYSRPLLVRFPNLSALHRAGMLSRGFTMHGDRVPLPLWPRLRRIRVRYGHEMK